MVTLNNRVADIAHAVQSDSRVTSTVLEQKGNSTYLIVDLKMPIPIGEMRAFLEQHARVLRLKPSDNPSILYSGRLRTGGGSKNTFYLSAIPVGPLPEVNSAF